MRKLKRAVAKARMSGAGIRRINKKSANGSYFSKHWREFV